MEKENNKSSGVGKIPIEIKWFDPQTKDLIEKISDENIEKIIKMWGLDISKINRIEIFSLNRWYHEMLYLISTTIGPLIIFIIFSMVTFLLYIIYEILATMPPLVDLVSLLIYVGINILVLSLCIKCFLSYHKHGSTGETLPGYRSIKIGIYNYWKKQGFTLEEVVIHELFHALSNYLALPTFFLSEGLAQVTSNRLTGQKPHIVEEDKNGYLHSHKKYIRTRKTKYAYVFSYWVVKYLTRDDENNNKLLSIIHKDVIHKNYNQRVKEMFGVKGGLTAELNDSAYLYYQEQFESLKES